MKKPNRSFRLVCSPDQIHAVESLLKAEGFIFEPEPFYPLARTLVDQPRPLGSSLAARFGYIYIQDKSSMLPPLALNPQPGNVVLDLCASPGSKTSLLSSLVGPTGLVVANEPHAQRLATLRMNMRHLECFNVVTTRYAGQHWPLGQGSWPLILVDAPCSGWGTTNKNPRAKEIWTPNKTKTLENLQQQLLQQAAQLLSPGGRLLYSTCTTHSRENEDQVQYALDHLGLSLQPLAPFPGFSFAHTRPGCLLVDGQDGGAQGFFLAALTRPGPETSPSYPPNDVFPKTMTAQEFSAQTKLDTSWLPEHEFLSTQGRLYLILQRAKEILSTMSWQGMQIGKTAKGSIFVDPTLRLFIPPNPQDQDLVLTEVQEIHALLAGQSRTYEGPAKRRALYYQNLPLGYLTVKGKRCLWSDR